MKKIRKDQKGIEKGRGKGREEVRKRTERDRKEAGGKVGKCRKRASEKGSEKGVGQGLDGEKLGPLDAIGSIGIPQLQESTVGDRVVAKVDIRRRKPQLGDETSLQVGHPREVNLPQKTGA